MLKDIGKFEKIRNAVMPAGRSLWCLGVHQTVPEETVLKAIKENTVFELNLDYVKISEIEGTEYSFTLF